jgi:hypothetical protein
MTFQRQAVVRLALAVTLITMFFAGCVFSVGQSEFIVHSFDQTGASSPGGNLAADAAGNLYGIANSGGIVGGTIYELVRPVPPKTAWTETEIYTFTGGADGSLPNAPLILDKAGNLYGTTEEGGVFGAGTVFELAAPAAAGGTWNESVLHSFQPATGDGGEPRDGLVWDSSGNLIGVAFAHGTNKACYRGCGTAFQLSPPSTPGGEWKETIIWNFAYWSGGWPIGTPILDAKGALYGATVKGGKGFGVVYRLGPPTTPGGAWHHRVIHTFTGGPDGGVSATGVGLTLHGRGVLYGTAEFGGLNGLGSVFQLVPPAVAGDEWTENVLYHFGATIGDGNFPFGVIFDSDGNIYGTTFEGGSGCSPECDGTVFQLTPPAQEGALWTETLLHSFAAVTDGHFPGGLIRAKNGVLFGVTEFGGAGGRGVVYGIVK